MWVQGLNHPGPLASPWPLFVFVVGLFLNTKQFFCLGVTGEDGVYFYEELCLYLL